MRINELCDLIGDDVDLDTWGVCVARQREPLKTRAARRDVPIAPELAVILRRRMDGKSPTDYVFCGAQGQALRLAVYVSHSAKHAGIQRVHFHSLRHFFASSLITAGKPHDGALPSVDDAEYLHPHS